MTLPLPTSLDRESVARWLAREICRYRDVLEQDYESADAVLALLAREVEKERGAIRSLVRASTKRAFEITRAAYGRMPGHDEYARFVEADILDRARSAVTDRGPPETSPSGDTGGAS